MTQAESLRAALGDLMEWFDRDSTPSLGAEGDRLMIVVGAALAATPPAEGLDVDIGPNGEGRPSMADDLRDEPWNDPNEPPNNPKVRAWLLRLTNHSGAPADVRDAALVLYDWIKP